MMSCNEFAHYCTNNAFAIPIPPGAHWPHASRRQALKTTWMHLYICSRYCILFSSLAMTCINVCFAFS